jgi:hypothetical protein
LEKEVKREKKLVYFYNPNFPGTSSYQEAIQNQIEKEYEELLAQGLIQLVDWREIIY